MDAYEQKLRAVRSMEEQGAEYTMKGQEHRCSSWRLGVAFTMPCLLVIACTAFTIHTCHTITSLLNVEKAYDGIFIQFHPISDISDNETLKFMNYTNKSVDLVDNKEIVISCNGPYILHMYVCPRGFNNEPGQGHLELRLAPEQQAITNFTLESRGGIDCKGLQTTVYLRREQRLNLYFSSKNRTLKIKNVILGLRYLLGQCQY
ncbi:uncharacterized protein LOC115555698 isoform X2 [Gadus morhua]|nr:uncharacterized protein LOC115555698 isoform X2 [Gadus morhua]